LLAATAAAGIFQVSGPAIFGVKPNWILTVLIIAAFLAGNFLELSILVLIAAILLRVQPGFFWPALIIGFLAFAVFWLKTRWPWQEFLNVILALVLATFIFYAIIDWQFFLKNYGPVLQEAFYNVIVGAGIYFVFQQWLRRR
jgi:hypothetical protein